MAAKLEYQMDVQGHKGQDVLSQDQSAINSESALLQQLAGKIKHGKSLSAELAGLHRQNRMMQRQLLQASRRLHQQQVTPGNAAEQRLAFQQQQAVKRVMLDTQRLQIARSRNQQAAIARLTTRLAADQQTAQSLQQKLNLLVMQQQLKQAQQNGQGGSSNSGGSGVVGAVAEVGSDAVNAVGSALDKAGQEIANWF